MKLPGLNIQTPWAGMLLNGQKSIETRTYPLPSKYIDQDMWLIETPGRGGSFKARIIAVIRFSECKKYNSEKEFLKDLHLHCVHSSDLEYFWKQSTPKYGWIVDTITKVQLFEAPSPRGIIYSRPFETNLRF